MHVTPFQTRRLGTWAKSREGETVPGAGAMTAAACWNFALTGTVLGGLDPNAPEQIYERIFDIDNFQLPPVNRGMRATATVVNFPGCGTELGVLNARHVAAIGGDLAARQECMEALTCIVLRCNGLVPLVAGTNNRYQLHMQTRSWFGWDHWAISLRAEQPGQPRIFFQTVTGQLNMRHACEGIWDEGLPGVAIELQELHATQVGLLNLVTDYGTLCVDCGARHWYTPSSPFNAWHRCTGCGAVYCPNHGSALNGNRGWNDRTRDCNRAGCGARTAIHSWRWV